MTDMWKEGNKVIFGSSIVAFFSTSFSGMKINVHVRGVITVTKVKERNAIALNAAAVTLGKPGSESCISKL